MSPSGFTFGWARRILVLASDEAGGAAPFRGTAPTLHGHAHPAAQGPVDTEPEPASDKSRTTVELATP